MYFIISFIISNAAITSLEQKTATVNGNFEKYLYRYRQQNSHRKQSCQTRHIGNHAELHIEANY